MEGSGLDLTSIYNRGRYVNWFGDCKTSQLLRRAWGGVVAALVATERRGRPISRPASERSARSSIQPARRSCTGVDAQGRLHHLLAARCAGTDLHRPAISRCRHRTRSNRSDPIRRISLTSSLRIISGYQKDVAKHGLRLHFAPGITRRDGGVERMENAASASFRSAKRPRTSSIGCTYGLKTRRI
jgi:hypothetical protein